MIMMIMMIMIIIMVMMMIKKRGGRWRRAGRCPLGCDTYVNRTVEV